MTKSKEKKHAGSRILTLVIFILGLITLAGGVSASTHMSNRKNRHTLEEGATLDGPGFFTGDLIQINGTVEGTTFAAGEDIQVNGTINGSLFAAGQRIVITGEVNGNIYGAGEVVELIGENDGEVFLAGENVTITEDAQVGRDAFTAAMNVRIEGDIPRHLYSAGETVWVNGSIGGDANIAAEQLYLNDSASVEGNLVYDSPNEAELDQGATVEGETNWTETEAWNMRRPLTQGTRWLIAFIWVMWSLFSTLLVWFIVRLIGGKDLWVDTVWPIADKPLQTVGTGFLGLILTPFIAGILMLTVIGIPMGIILFMLYGIALYVAKIIVALFMGALLFRVFGRTEGNNEFLVLLIGLVIIEILMIIPIVNLITILVVSVIGLGALILSRREGNKKMDRFAEY